MFSSIQSIPGLIFARSDVKANIRPGVEANGSSFGAFCQCTCAALILETQLYSVTAPDA